MNWKWKSNSHKLFTFHKKIINTFCVQVNIFISNCLFPNSKDKIEMKFYSILFYRSHTSPGSIYVCVCMWMKKMYLSCFYLLQIHRLRVLFTLTFFFLPCHSLLPLFHMVSDTKVDSHTRSHDAKNIC